MLSDMRHELASITIFGNPPRERAPSVREPGDRATSWAQADRTADRARVLRGIRCVEFFDDGPDSMGRRRFALGWWQDGAIYSKEIGREHLQVGWGPRMRWQHFFADPSRYLAGYPVERDEGGDW